MAITLNVSGSTVLDLTLMGSDESVLLGATTSGVTLTAEESEEILMAIETDDITLKADTGESIPYSGSYEWTPTDEIQTISIEGKTASADIIINPIPSNYGLITWNGSILTVS